MSLISQVRDFLWPSLPAPQEERGLWDPMQFMTYGGTTYPLLGLNQTYPGEKQEELDGSFASFVAAQRANGVVFALMAARLRLFTQTRFQWRRLRFGKPGDLFGTKELGILERPWPNGNTADLLARMIQDVDLAGNFYAVRRGADRIRRMRPDWVSIVLDRPAEELDAEVIGYVYHPGGTYSSNAPVPLDVDEVAHFVEFPDPTARYRGMSWITPLAREVMADSAANTHKLGFFERGATPNLVIKRSDDIGKDAFNEWVQLMRAGHEGAANAYKTLFLSAGADATVVGANLRQLDFALVQGHGETRMASAAGVPPIVAGLSEGLAAATYSNYGQARRAFADLTMMGLWGNAAKSLQTIVPPPSGAELWFDADIPFLAEDKQDQANIANTSASTITALITNGFKPDDAVKAVTSNDLTLLIGSHTGLPSVQLQPALAAPAPEAEEEEPEAEPETEAE